MASAHDPTITVYGAPWCPHCKRVKRFLAAHRVPYDNVDIEDRPEAIERLKELQGGGQIIPMVVFGDGTHEVNPSDETLAGRIGLRLVDKGNIIHATDVNGLAVITQLQPIAVVFNIPEDSLRQVMPKFSAGVKFPVLAYDRDLRRRLADGMLLTIDNQVDSTTGTVKFKAQFPNTDSALFPNQFVNARLLFDTRHGAVIVPTAALQRSPTSTYVYVIGSDRTVKMRNIVTTLTEGDNAAVDSGLEAGETVVVDGLDKLQDGTRVQVTMAPSQDKAQDKAKARAQTSAQDNQ